MSNNLETNNESLQNILLTVNELPAASSTGSAVTSVNGRTGAVVLDASDVGAALESHDHSATEITSGTLPVERGGTGNISIDTTPTSGSTKMVTSDGIYAALNDKAPNSHMQSANTISAGTFAGRVIADITTQSPSVMLIRNSNLVTTAATPSNNGEICWTYE